MSAGTLNPWTQGRVPTLLDAGSPKLRDEEGDFAPVKDGTMLYAAMVMMLFYMAASASIVASSCIVTVKFVAGAPQVESFIAPNTSIGLADFTFVENATGDTTVRLPIGKVPPKRTRPIAGANEGTNVGVTADEFSDDDYRGARVKTWAGGTLADLKFTVQLW